MNRRTALALRCYPPSWQERYGEELAELAHDGDGLDLLVGAARAWLRPAGPCSLAARRVSTISTVYVSWCAAFVGTLVYLKAVNDPPLPGLTTGASQPLWGLAKAAFFLGWVVVLIGGTGLLLRIAVPAVRARSWQQLRPMLPAAILLVLVLGTIPVLGISNHASAAGVVAVLGWLGLGFALVVAGAVGPVLVLRRSGLTDLRAPAVAAVAVAALAVLLGAATVGQAALLTTTDPVSRFPGEVSVLSDALTPYTLTMMWGAVTLIAIAAATSAVSAGRVLRAR